MKLFPLMSFTIYIIHCVGIDAVIGNINRTPLQGIVLTATKPPVVITISNLPTGKCSTKVPQNYFSNKKKSGINTFEAIKVVDKPTAVLQLKDESGENDLK